MKSINNLPQLKDFLKNKMSKQDKVFGKKSIFGQMPDWNPVEMIGRTPKTRIIFI